MLSVCWQQNSARMPGDLVLQAASKLQVLAVWDPGGGAGRLPAYGANLWRHVHERPEGSSLRSELTAAAAGPAARDSRAAGVLQARDTCCCVKALEGQRQVPFATASSSVKFPVGSLWGVVLMHGRSTHVT